MLWKNNLIENKLSIRSGWVYEGRVNCKMKGEQEINTVGQAEQ